MFKFTSKSVKETTALGERLSKLLKPGDIVCLSGDLGSGKTTLVKGVAQGLKLNPAKVNSPTFVLMNVYEGKIPLYHFDLYRINQATEMSLIGYDEFFYGNGIAVVEWAERLEKLFPMECLIVDLKHKAEEERQIEISACGKKYEEIVKSL